MRDERFASFAVRSVVSSMPAIQPMIERLPNKRQLQFSRAGARDRGSMGGIYKRHSKLWIWYFSATGERIFEPTSARVGEEARARTTLEGIERRIEAEKRTGIPAGELTVKGYGERWLKERPAQGIGTAADEAARLRHHAWPILGHVLLKQLRPHHVRDMVRALKLKKSARGVPLAPRTIRHVYGHLHAMLHEAVVDELIGSNPCALSAANCPRRSTGTRPGAAERSSPARKSSGSFQTNESPKTDGCSMQLPFSRAFERERFRHYAG